MGLDQRRRHRHLQWWAPSFHWTKKVCTKYIVNKYCCWCQWSLRVIQVWPPWVKEQDWVVAETNLLALEGWSRLTAVPLLGHGGAAQFDEESASPSRLSTSSTLSKWLCATELFTLGPFAYNWSVVDRKRVQLLKLTTFQNVQHAGVCTRQEK